MSDEVIIVGGGARGMYFTQMLTQTLGRKVAAIAETYVGGHEAIRRRLDELGTPETRIFTSVDEVLDAVPRSRADKLFVMTPEWTHLEVFRKALDAGCHVFLEKPVATTREDALEVLRLAQSTEKTVQVGFVLRYSSFYQKIKSVIDSGALGRVVCIQMNERLALWHGGMFRRTWHRKVKYTGGFMNEKCSHDLDLMCWFKEGQASPTHVSSFGGQLFCPPGDTPEFCTDCTLEHCPWRYKLQEQSNGDESYSDVRPRRDRCVYHSDADIADHQTVNILFDDGTHGVFTVIAMSVDPGRDIIIHGTHGYLQGNMEHGQLRMQRYWGGEMEDIDLGITDGHGGGDTGIVSGFLESAGNGLKPLATVEAGVRASLIAFAADESIATKSTVRLG